ncbi:ABC transporter ATP-binding protein [Blastococcus mobilis]|uniref:Spermidine/putrescine import ATP-binding protein PotA n=1 Tax=Blastococcus mobilis TaxID=1938746 RepID=A0A238YE94_9ACTN|nr:ABC transporter ATP-binding protein [Blastococcus mobilis]SNR69380.1 putative spermidine/putrescine transport system ATP-binding protein [Blastococcus mobilis]
MQSQLSRDAGTSIDIRNVVKRYKGQTAVDDVTLSVEAGEFLTLLGASGSGKSTLLNIVAGFITADAGRIEVGGRDLTTVPPHRRDLGMVFQHYALFPHMTVWQNVAFPLKRRRVAKAQIASRVRQALEVVELGHLAERRPAQLSGGQQQRVALARAIVFEPQALLMDEPLGALDKRLREQLQLEIKRLHHELGTTFVFVTHDQEEALAMSDRIALLRDGRVVQIGSPQDLYDRPASRYAAEFLGESNLFTGRCDGRTFVDERSGAAFTVAAGGNGVELRNGSALVVRPEHVMLAADDAPLPADHNTLDGLIRDVTYLGSGLRVEVALPDGRHLVTRTGTRSGLRPQPGLPVVAHWHAEHAVVVADDTGAAVSATVSETASTVAA